MLALGDHNVTMPGILLKNPVGNRRKLQIYWSSLKIHLRSYTFLLSPLWRCYNIWSRLHFTISVLQGSSSPGIALAMLMLHWPMVLEATTLLLLLKGLPHINIHICWKHFLYQGLCLYPELKSGQRNRRRPTWPWFVCFLCMLSVACCTRAQTHCSWEGKH